MISRNKAGLILMLTTILAGCGGDDPATTDSTSTTSTTSTTGAGGAGGGGTGGAGGSDTSTSTGTATSTSSASSSSSGTGGAAPMCTAARDQALGPIDSVSTGDVKELSATGTTRKIYVDASAGGVMGAATNPGFI